MFKSIGVNYKMVECSLQRFFMVQYNKKRASNTFSKGICTGQAVMHELVNVCSSVCLRNQALLPIYRRP